MGFIIGGQGPPNPLVVVNICVGPGVKLVVYGRDGRWCNSFYRVFIVDSILGAGPPNPRIVVVVGQWFNAFYFRLVKVYWGHAPRPPLRLRAEAFILRS